MEEGEISIPIVPIKKLTQITCFSQDHTVNEQYKQGLNHIMFFYNFCNT